MLRFGLWWFFSGGIVSIFYKSFTKLPIAGLLNFQSLVNLKKKLPGKSQGAFIIHFKFCLEKGYPYRNGKYIGTEVISGYVRTDVVYTG